jgi:hypothetical protein
MVDEFDSFVDNFSTGMTERASWSCCGSGRPRLRVSEVRMSDSEHLDFRLLKYIVAIAEAGTFTAAASRFLIVNVERP